MSVLDTLRAATPRTLTEAICLDAALEAEHQQLVAQLGDTGKADDVAVSEADGSLADPMPRTRALVEEIEAIRDRMAASEVTFTFTNIPWTQRLELQAANPPRDGNLVDGLRGWNTETFTRALIRACCSQVTDAAGDTTTEIPEDVWEQLLGAEEQPGTLNYQQVNRLFAAALRVTDGDTRVPRSARFLLESQDSGASLAQPGPGTSPRSGSAGGSRRTSRKSSATSKAGSSDS